MKHRDTYAVVDIETTGGNAANGDRIIQFGCILIEEGKIVQEFSTDVNPLVSIPKNIENLTGLSNKTVANAPYFEDVAPTIYNLLESCIFVAHNIQFDYRFLSEELVRCGLPELTMKGIDTVELSQILLPTEHSFRLADLAETLNIVHESPHQAVSDAMVTAELFLLLRQKLKRLPLVTVERLAEIAPHCTMETAYFFKEALNELRTELPPFPKNLLIRNGIAIRKKTTNFEQRSYWNDDTYPLDNSSKEALFKDKLAVRESQVTMMNAVYDNFSTNEEEHFVIEAATGIGKTLGYLLPSAYLSAPDDPILISTYTTLLQKQLLEKDIAQLNAVLPFKIHAAILKSKYHYLHLAKFQEVLKDPVEHLTDAILRMRTLTWLTETTTGDLDELNLTNYIQPFWNKIRHRGWLKDAQDDPWYDEDFYLHARNEVKHASLIITNHAFFCHDLQRKEKEFPTVQRIIIDEAHHFSDIATSSSSELFSYYRIQRIVNLIGKSDDTDHFFNRVKLLKKNHGMLNSVELDSIEMSVFALDAELGNFVDLLLEYCNNEMPLEKTYLDQIDIPFSMSENWSMTLKRSVKNVLAYLEDICYSGFSFVNQVIDLHSQLTHRERHLVDGFYELIRELEEQKEIFLTIFQKNADTEVTWFSYKKKSPKSSFSIKHSRTISSDFLQQHLLNQTRSILYTGATLGINGDFTYFEEQLGERPLKKMLIPTEYDYQKQAKLWIPENIASIKTLTKAHYAKMIVEQLESIAGKSTENILVLFNANEPLQEVYSLLQSHSAFSGREVLAQGLSGSRDRILKRFFRSKGSILLGADSFWEGVDLPGKSLRIIVVTRLPFESPERPFTKAKYQWLVKQNLSPFSVEALPKATIKLKQALGRLIRSKEDKGVMIVLDDRLMKSSYGKYMLESLPAELTAEIVPQAEIEEKLNRFLENDE